MEAELRAGWLAVASEPGAGETPISLGASQLKVGLTGGLPGLSLPGGVGGVGLPGLSLPGGVGGSTGLPGLRLGGVGVESGPRAEAMQQMTTPRELSGVFEAVRGRGRIQVPAGLEGALCEEIERDTEVCSSP